MAALTQQRLSILDLPQELQDIIFDYAYNSSGPSIHPSSLIGQSFMQSHAKSKLQFGKVVTYKVSEWLICKRWFVQAARAYAESIVVNAGAACPDDMEYGPTDGPYEGTWFDLDDATGILAAFATSVRTNFHHVAYDGPLHRERFPRLRHLHVTVYEGKIYERLHMADSEVEHQLGRDKVNDLEGEVRRRTMSDEELMKRGPFQAVKNYPGIGDLRTVKLEARDYDCDRPSFEPQFVRNVARMEELIKKHLLGKEKKSEACKTDSDESDMLYPGSKVDTKPHISKARIPRAEKAEALGEERFRLVQTRQIVPPVREEHKRGQTLDQTTMRVLEITLGLAIMCSCWLWHLGLTSLLDPVGILLLLLTLRALARERGVRPQVAWY